MNLGFRNAGLGLTDIKFDDNQLDLNTDDRNPELVALKKELGIVLQDKQTEATIMAFQDPLTAFKKYQADRKKIDIDAVNTFKAVGKQAEDAGLPKDAAVQYARKRATVLHQLDSELLNLVHPYANTPEGLVALASGVKRKDLIKPPKK